jgi:hypothetical protein
LVWNCGLIPRFVRNVGARRGPGAGSSRHRRPSRRRDAARLLLDLADQSGDLVLVVLRREVAKRRQRREADQVAGGVVIGSTGPGRRRQRLRGRLGCGSHPEQGHAAGRTAWARGRRVSSTAGSHRSLRARALRWRMCWPVSDFQRAHLVVRLLIPENCRNVQHEIHTRRLRLRARPRLRLALADLPPRGDRRLAGLETDPRRGGRGRRCAGLNRPVAAGAGR